MTVPPGDVRSPETDHNLRAEFENSLLPTPRGHRLWNKGEVGLGEVQRDSRVYAAYA